jgi:predicted helicase
MTRQHIVFLTGAGISVESGLSTFRGKDGMWTNEEWAYLASTDALYNDTQRCLDFYNWRRKQLSEVEPNDAHRMIAELEKEYLQKFKKILPASKILKVQNAEEQFNSQILKDIQQSRGHQFQQGQNRPMQPQFNWPTQKKE